MNLKNLCLVLALICLTFSFTLKKSMETNGFDIVKSRKYSGYASLAYCPKKCLESWTCKTGEKFPPLVNVTHINNDITLAAVYIGY